MRYKIIYSLFIIGAVLYANFRLFGSITPRHIMTIIMFLTCIVEDKRIFNDKWNSIYLVYIASFGLSSFLTDYFEPYLRYLIGFFFVAYVGYWATRILIRKYNGDRLFINLLVFIGMIDAAATIGQFFNIPLFRSIPDYMGIHVDLEFLDSFGYGEEAFGFVLPGIMPTDIINGYFLMFVCVLSLSYLRKGLNIIRLIPFAIAIIALYMVQQRSPFYLAMLASIFIFLKILSSGQSRKKRLFLFAFIIALPFMMKFVFDFLLTGEGRYNMGFEANNRDSIYRQSLEYINENFLFGGWFRLKDTFGFAPHNLFLNAWIYGGFLGFMAIVLLTTMQSISVIRAMLSKIDEKKINTLIIGVAFLCFTMNSMLHNLSTVTGDLTIWLLWGAYVGAEKMNSSNVLLDCNEK